MSRRVLIVVSSYAPAMIADMHRARQLSWELPRFGWAVEILSPDASYQKPFCLDPDSGDFFAPDTKVHWIASCCAGAFNQLGLGGIGWRAVVPMLRAGGRLLRSRRFDLVYISTTQFPLFIFGPWWQRWRGVPYVVDIHDPLCREGKATPVWARPSMKHRLSRALTCWMERRAVVGAAGLIAVSPSYIDTLIQRYEAKRPVWLSAERRSAVPFGVLPADFDSVSRRSERDVGARRESARIVYVGAGGPIMQRSFGLLCRVLALIKAETPEALDGVGIDLLGTQFGWRDGDPRHLTEVAAAAGVEESVREDPRRVTYRGSLECLIEAQGALILGVEDDGYMPSKLFSYAWSGKPLLAVLRRRSPAYALFESMPGLGHALWFDHGEDIPLGQAATVVRTFLAEVKRRRTFDRGALLDPFVASEMARRHAALFDRCLAAD
jgi:hypothetical protein